MAEKLYNVNLNEKELTMLCNLLHQKNEHIDDREYEKLEEKLTDLYYTK